MTVRNKPDRQVKCAECDWTGPESEMGADSIDVDMWSNHICPSCGYWNYEDEVDL